MKNGARRNSIVHTAVFAGLWFINIVIVIFAAPYLIYRKLKEIFTENN